MDQLKYTYKELLDRIDFAFLISVIVTLSGAWLYLYNLIIEMTDVDKYEICFGIACCHYILTLYIFIALYMIFKKGNRIIMNDSANKYRSNSNGKLIVFFMNSWLYCLLFAIFTVIYFQLSFWSGDAMFLIYMFIAIVFVLFLAYSLCKSFFNKTILRMLATIISSGILSVGFFIFLVIVSSLAMQIKFNSDKEIYDYGETATIIIYRQGYIFKPYYKVSDNNNYNIYGNGNSLKVSTDLFKNSYESNLKIDYYNSYFERLKISRYRFIPIYIRPKDGQYH